MCLYPKLIPNRKWVANKKNNGNPPECKDERTKWVAAGCGKCFECRRQKARSWAVRMQEEVKHDKNGTFVTLTFSTESLIELSEEITVDGYERDNQIATKAVRYFLERWRKRTGKSVKHWLVTELGHGTTEHIHLHGIIFSKDRAGIEKNWKYGYVYLGKYVNEKTVNYCVKYVSKVDAEHKYYNPKILCSKGLGKNYLKRDAANSNRFQGTATKEYYKTNNGSKLNLPVYYRNKIYTDEEREALWVAKLDKKERWVNKRKAETDEEYWIMLREARFKNEELGYGNDEQDWDRKQYERKLRNLRFKERQRKLSEKLNSYDMDD